MKGLADVLYCEGNFGENFGSVPWVELLVGWIWQGGANEGSGIRAPFGTHSILGAMLRSEIGPIETLDAILRLRGAGG